MLKKCLQEIMDLDEPFVEANKKLIDTYIFINDELVYLKEIGEGTGTVIVEDLEHRVLKRMKVSTIKVFLPETGIYPLEKGGFVFLTRLPKKQWHKSFTTNNYSFLCVNCKKDSKTILNISKSKRYILYVDSDKQIYYLTRCIGYIKNAQEVVCTNLNFKQELKDWIKYAY